MAVNSGKTARKMPKGVPFKKGKGVDPRINRKGAPVRGQSFQEAVARLVDMSNKELADYFGRKSPLGRQFLLQPPIVPMRDVIIARAIVTLANDFDSRGFEKLTDRSEGKPSQSIDLSNKDGTLNPEEMKPSEIAERVAALLKAKDANGS